MAWILDIGRTMGDLMLAPFAPLPEWLSLVGLSVVLGVVLLITFRWLTPQGRLKALRAQMMGAIYEMRIFIHSPRAILRAQGRLVWQNLEYIALVLPALLLVAPPVIALFARADMLYGFRPFQPGEEVLVRVEFADPAPARETLRISGSEGLAVKEPMVLLPAAREAWVAVEMLAAGAATLTVTAGAASETKSVLAAEPGTAPTDQVSPIRAVSSNIEMLLSSEPFIAVASPVRAIELEYPVRQQTVPWWVTVLLLSMVVAFALRKPLGVTL